MFRRILIANRGEVAARVMRTAHRMGIEVVAVASTADRHHKWLDGADAVVTIGSPAAADSYLDQDALIEVALHHQCSAVHPGWGFLAENDQFALRCAAAGITFIGPSARHLREMGDKSLARATMTALGLEPIPGSDAPVDSVQAAGAMAKTIGFPVLLKAVAGGGGRGMRPVERPEDLASGFEQASAESLAAFGDGRLYMERMIRGGRHVEVQVIADRYGNCVHLGERECSIQRRHQKVVEEAPSPGLSSEERGRILPKVIRAVAESGYVNAGTVEMLVDADGYAWFMEMNTRLQVEHSVTEETTGVDLVEWQLRVAAGQRLPVTQVEVEHRGCAIECRINAEDPDQNFRPSPGRITRLTLPEGEGIRVDTHLTSGDRIPPHYDSMIAKLIASGPDRPTAMERMRRALAQTVVEGVTTNIRLHERILDWEPFVSGHYDTKSLERWLGGEA